MSESLKVTRNQSFGSRETPAVYWQNFDTTFFLIASITIFTGIWSFIKFKGWYRDKARLLYLASKLPGPPTVPLIGIALRFACNSDESLERMMEISRNYGSPMRIWLGPKLLIVLTEPRDYEIILGCQKASYKHPVYRFFEPLLGQGLLSESGPTHRSHRKLIIPMLNSKALNEYVEHFDFHSRVCVELLDEKVDTGEFNIHPFLSHCTLDMHFDTILGVPGSSQTEGHNELVYWSEKLYELVHMRMIKVWLHLDWILSMTKLGKELKNGRNVIQGFIETVVKRKKKEHTALERGAIVSDRPRVRLLEQLIEQVAKTNLMNDDQLRDEINTVFIAALDTTTVISSFALVNLAMNQEIQDKVREEIKEVVGNENVRMEHLPELKYIEMVIKETLRLYPICPMMVRQVRGDIEVETCTLPKGCTVVMAPFITHRSEKFWKEPEKFIPERFLPENSANRHPYAYVPFSGGSRACIGQRYAIMCIKTILVHIVRKYRLRSTKTLETLRLKTDISIRSRDGYMVSISRV